MDTCLIGVDGGGTACRVAVVRAGQRYEVVLGAANVASDPAGAIATVRDGIRQASAQAGVEPAGLARARAHVALAGIMSEADERAVAGALGLADVRVSDDRVATVTGALGLDSGSVAGIGTGSFLARQQGGKMRFVGGWGLGLGDEASGAWLGRGLLSATLHAADGLAAGSDLCDAMRHRFETLAGIVAFANRAGPDEFARLAPAVASAAEAGDGVARALMQDGAAYILRGLGVLGWTAGDPVCLTGGLAGAYLPWLEDRLGSGLRAPLGTALDGALLLAARQGGDDAP